MKALNAGITGQEIEGKGKIAVELGESLLGCKAYFGIAEVLSLLRYFEILAACRTFILPKIIV
ncbi:hypothetical protein H7F10_16420 [Acidithiobacillus sp. HP-6]|uniref:hypothetical protein n=1 Tax=unclassified Acidithiobacillus TaxID=2614800 RepID=UPI001879661A|nr:MULTISPECIES: hypothetical protein [unclassified Acidithiobacillus]MBE7564462.1 hypothetical protein [Acidithiobacillus sp. HP-6]MBE7571108.1 hypothetical protein [Acidithiobacillus sp. HP-2]